MVKPNKKQEYFSVLEEKKYKANEAIDLLKSAPKSNFIESIDVAVNLGIDPSKSDQTVRSATSLPAGTGKECKVAVFTDGDQAKEATEAGADIVGMEDLVLKALEPDKYRLVKKKVNNTKKEREKYIEKLISPIQKELKENNINSDIFGRAKHYSSIIGKMEKRNKKFEEKSKLFEVLKFVEKIDTRIKFPAS